jgi:transcriptional accessory protein Tex/SPT6
MSTIDDGELCWKLAVDAPAQLVTARKEESAVVAESMPAGTNTSPYHNISEKLVLDQLRKEIEEDVRRTVEEELRKSLEEEVRNLVEGKLRKMVEAGLALLGEMVAGWKAQEIMF